MVLCLTSTPFINKPAELVSQLKLIDGLHNLTPKPQASNDERAWAANFRKKWCRTLTVPASAAQGAVPDLLRQEAEERARVVGSCLAGPPGSGRDMSS